MSSLFPKARYEVWLGTPEGERLRLIEQFSDLSFAKAFGSVGRFEMVVPSTPANRFLVLPEYTIQIWRAPQGSLSKLQYVGFIRTITFTEYNKNEVIVISGEDGNSLLKSRIIAYASNTTESSKSGAIDNQMKEVVRENLGADATDPARDLSSSGLEVDVDYSLAPVKYSKHAWDSVIETLNDLADMSANFGTPLFFEIAPKINTRSVGWRFRTSINVLGADRSSGSMNPTIFSKENGNLENPELTYDFSNEANYIYVGGEGQGEERKIEEIEDSARVNRTPFSRKERFVDFRNMPSDEALSAKAGAELNNGLPSIRFVGSLKDTPQTIYGVDWEYGDKITISYQGISFDAWINAVRFSLDEEGNERIDARVEVIA